MDINEAFSAASDKLVVSFIIAIVCTCIVTVLFHFVFTGAVMRGTAPRSFFDALI